MMFSRRQVLQSLAATAATLPLGGCWLNPAEWHKKLTVTVSTPSGDKSGSAVRWKELGEAPLFKNAYSSERGEAVVVEVLPGRYLFALIEHNKPQEEVLFFPKHPPLKSAYWLDSWFYGVKGQVMLVPPSHYPMFVTFTDINDPASVVQVFPDKMEEHFGASVKFKSMTLEITDEPVTEFAWETVFPWFKRYETSYLSLNGKRCIACPDDGSFAETIGTGHFRIGVTK